VLTINVKGDMRRILRHADAVQRRHVPAATVRALNRTMSWVRTQAKREGAAALKVPVGHVNRRMRSYKASKKNRSALLTFITGGISAATLKPRQTKKGVTAGRHRFAGAFVAKGIAGKTVVFKRKAPSPYPLEGKKIDTGPAVRRITNVVRDSSRDRFNFEFERDLKARIKGYGAR